MINISSLFYELVHGNENVIEFFKKVLVSNHKTSIKWGHTAKSININFFIYGKTDKKDIDLPTKLDLLFNTDENLTDLTAYLNQIKAPFDIICSPYLKINTDPTIHAFMLTINHEGI